MKVLVKTKLLEGIYIEAREYELFKQPIKLIHCTSSDYKTCTHENDEYMTLTINQQKKGKITNTQQSKFPPYSYYRMYKFLWKPQKPEKNLDEKPTSIMGILSNLSSDQIKELRDKLDKKQRMV